MTKVGKTNLILPFKGTWIIGNGGQDPLKNNHISPDRPLNQQFAYDFKKEHQNEGRKLEYYQAFGEEVIVPADGVIIQTIDGSIDVLPGERDRSVGVGNAVLIDHQNGEFSMLCHFKYNSIKVTVGDQVKQGDLLGLCGNTGNTSEPHIHFNLQDQPLMHKANPLIAVFNKIKVDGKVKTNTEPVRGQQVANI